jgi:hypothetical protein
LAKAAQSPLRQSLLTESCAGHGGRPLMQRGWIKLKNPNYWRRDAELEAMQRSR